MKKVLKILAKLILAGFAGTISLIAIFLPYEWRKSYIQFWLRFKHVINVIF